MASNSSQNLIHGINQLLDGGDRFVTHVGDPEGTTLDFAVTAVDQKVVLVFKGFDEP